MSSQAASAEGREQGGPGSRRKTRFGGMTLIQGQGHWACMGTREQSDQSQRHRKQNLGLHPGRRSHPQWMWDHPRRKPDVG